MDGPEISYASVMAGPAFHEDPRFQGAALGYASGEAPWMQAVTAMTSLVTAVAMATGTGAEALKLYAMMEAPVVVALTAEAHQQGMRVVAHGTVFPARSSELVAAGVDVLTHAAYLSWEGAPTIRDTDSWDRMKGPYDTVRPDGLIGDGRRDLPNIHGEMAALVKAGLSPAQALAAATVTPARLMRHEATHGAVAPGHVADLVPLTADPLADIAATREIRWVVRKGHLMDVGR